MNILVINGSPKGEKSSTLRITNAFLDGIRSKLQDTASIETITVSTTDIKDCRGCFCCWTESPGKCILHDDMENILPKIINADILIWSFPLYYFGMPSKVKALLDRNLPTCMPQIIERGDNGYTHQNRYHNQIMDTVLISTAGLGAVDNNFEALIKQFEIIYDGSLIKILCSQGGAFPHDNVDNYLSYAKQAGREYALKRCISVETQNKLDALLYPPEVYVKLANASWNIKDEKNEVTVEEKNKGAAERFTRQMAALYNPVSFDGVERVLEMNYTDVDTTYQLVMKKDKCEVRSSDFIPYTTRIETPLTVWKDISKGIYSGEQAMMEGKYRTIGDLKLLMSWNRYFGHGNKESFQPSGETEANKMKSNMAIMIIPWFVIWVLLSIEPLIGGIAGIVTAACVHFANFKWKLTTYDYITCVSVSIFSLLAILGANMQIVISLSYLCFGLMWLASCLTPIPLTANYSKNDYNGDEALRNPLFIKTNIILTVCWGVLYFITPIWTYFILGGAFAYLTGAINAICPALLGAFTAWFQKWYPTYIAGGREVHRKIT